MEKKTDKSWGVGGGGVEGAQMVRLQTSTNVQHQGSNSGLTPVVIDGNQAPAGNAALLWQQSVIWHYTSATRKRFFGENPSRK